MILRIGSCKNCRNVDLFGIAFKPKTGETQQRLLRGLQQADGIRCPECGRVHGPAEIPHKDDGTVKAQVWDMEWRDASADDFMGYDDNDD